MHAPVFLASPHPGDIAFLFVGRRLVPALDNHKL